MMTYRTANTLLDRMFSDLSRSAAAQLSHPASTADLLEFATHFTVRLALPGVKPEDLDVSLEGRTLTVKGKYTAFDNGDAKVLTHGLQQGEFSRTLKVPAGVGEGVTARLEQGILTLEIPKPATAQARRIEVSSGEKTLDSAQA